MSERWALSLREVLAQVPDPRQPRGRRHPLAAILALAVCAMLGGCRSLYAMAQWGRDHPELAQTLGFTREQTPCVATLHHVFRRLDAAAFAAALSQWALAALPAGAAALAVDGKALRGLHGDELPGVRLVAAYAAGAAALAVDGKALRGLHGDELPGVRLVAAYAVGAGLVVGQKGGQGAA